MDFPTIAILAFILVEGANICILYFRPSSLKGNGVGAFAAYEKLKDDPEAKDFVGYLVNWIAGTKLIFILLLAVILAFGNEATRIGAAVALVLSILSFFWRLFPAIRKMDKAGGIRPAGYSKTLAFMIAGMIVLFAAAALSALR
ncbi:MAG: hypothetical protein JNG85_14310 [Spirochaetaceae bacterium]|nr:hypothetical protein [Spirochaetaceae bacterium]